ncbi:S4 domain-containing protein YaaA [Lacticaseibacillus hulanensis]|uniref:S4 domain-containing protein YaaA n=1 Tax=Lacticaseibacillus hulanensis TaxID=2493111 RepID=UPI000FD85A16|nr:S4 domain-containing protein YaaA [Lacticaseibacillus hulanensis]
MQTITISTPYITLGQFLKEAGVIDSGGAAKWYLAENSVEINGVEDNRRGRKLVAGDKVILNDGNQFTLAQE